MSGHQPVGGALRMRRNASRLMPTVPDHRLVAGPELRSQAPGRDDPGPHWRPNPSLSIKESQDAIWKQLLES